MYNGYILFLTFHCIALGIGINGEGGGEEGSVQLCRENFCNNNWYITGEKKEKKEKKARQGGKFEMRDTGAILNGIIKWRLNRY